VAGRVVRLGGAGLVVPATCPMGRADVGQR